ncbi:MAG: type II toxin-antitoxin system Phd/YefM family antitoxin [Limisphaerales bacterium]
MKKLNAREFQKAFSKVADELRQGETVEITRYGKSLGYFTRSPGRAPVKMPDFAAALSSVPFIGSAGERIMAETLDEAIS